MPVGNTLTDKLCLKNPHPERFKNLAVGFTVYHALKLGHRQVIEQALNTRQFEALARQAKLQAETANNLLTSLVPTK